MDVVVFGFLWGGIVILLCISGSLLIRVNAILKILEQEEEG
jgi:hypothetical protein